MDAACWVSEVDRVIQARAGSPLPGKQGTPPGERQLETGRQATPLRSSGAPRLVGGCTEGFRQWEPDHGLSRAKHSGVQCQGRGAVLTGPGWICGLTEVL